jgi:hypothetical protein
MCQGPPAVSALVLASLGHRCQLGVPSAFYGVAWRLSLVRSRTMLEAPSETTVHSNYKPASRAAVSIAVSAGVVALVLSIALLCAALLVLQSNVVYTVERLGLGLGGAISSWFTDAAPTQAASGATRMSAAAALARHPGWVQPLLKDLSSISALLVVLTALQMLLGALRLLSGNAGNLARVHFPFHRSYQTYFVQLGLIGTVVGFVLAFSEVGVAPEAAEQTQVLLDALGTALWSTLTALVLAYMFGPSVEFVYAALARTRTGLALTALRRWRNNA